MLRQIIALSAVAVVLGAAAGCSQPAKPKEQAQKIKIGFIVKQAEEPWFQQEWRFAQEAADKDGFELIKLSAPLADDVESRIDSLASQGAQGFIICTPDTKLGDKIVAKAKEHNLKLFTVDDQLLDKDKRPMTDVHHMGISATEIGALMGQALVDEMKKRGWSPADTAAMAITSDSLETARQRTDSAIEVLSKSGFPADKIYKAPESKTDVEHGSNAANVCLVQHGDVKHWLVCGMNDEAVLGAVRALENHQFKAENVIGVGIGGTKPAQDEFERNTGFFATILISPKRHGFETADLMYHWIKDGKEPPMLTFTKGIPMNRENWHQALKEQGLSD